MADEQNFHEQTKLKGDFAENSLSLASGSQAPGVTGALETKRRAVVLGRMPNGNLVGFITDCCLPMAWTETGKNVGGYHSGYDLSASEAATPVQECHICGKPKGQPPDRCPGHYEPLPVQECGYRKALEAESPRLPVAEAVKMAQAYAEIGQLNAEIERLKIFIKEHSTAELTQWALSQPDLDASKPLAEALKGLMERMRSEAAQFGSGAVSQYIDDHGMTCDCCQHILIDVTAARDGVKQHCIAGDPEGDGSACANGWMESWGKEIQRAEAAEQSLAAVREENERLPEMFKVKAEVDGKTLKTWVEECDSRRTE